MHGLQPDACEDRSLMSSAVAVAANQKTGQTWSSHDTVAERQEYMTAGAAEG